MLGAGMMGTETGVTEGDLVHSGGAHGAAGNGRGKGDTERGGVCEESERFIVVMTPGESREERRDRSRGGVFSAVGASARRPE